MDIKLLLGEDSVHRYVHNKEIELTPLTVTALEKYQIPLGDIVLTFLLRHLDNRSLQEVCQEVDSCLAIQERKTR